MKVKAASAASSSSAAAAVADDDEDDDALPIGVQRLLPRCPVL
jgi:hypothetical protein